MAGERPHVPASLRIEKVEICDFCGSREKVPVHPDIHMVRCGSCDLTYLDQRPLEGDLGHLYGKSYFNSSDSQEFGYDDYLSERPQIVETFRRRLRNLEQRFGKPPGRLLDVGCATGFFLDIARDSGWSVEGVDVSKYAAGLAREMLGVHVHIGPLTVLPRSDQPYDVVTMWDVIEHSIGPMKDFDTLANLVRPGGLLVLATPDLNSWPARLYGKKWMGIKPNEHFFYFSRTTLIRYLEKAGFAIERTSTIGKYVSVGFFIKRLGHYYPRMARVAMRLARVLRLIELSLYVDPRDLMIVYARRPEGEAGPVVSLEA